MILWGKMIKRIDEFKQEMYRNAMYHSVNLLAGSLVYQLQIHAQLSVPVGRITPSKSATKLTQTVSYEF